MTLPTPDNVADETENVYKNDMTKNDAIDVGFLAGVWEGAKVGGITTRKIIAKELRQIANEAADKKGLYHPEKAYIVIDILELATQLEDEEKHNGIQTTN